MAKNSLSYFDRLWMRLDDPNNRVIITGIILLGAKLNYKLFDTSLENTLSRYKRFRQRVVHPRMSLRRPYWEDDPDFDLDQHIEKRLLPPPADKVTLEKLISELMSVNLDVSRPLWKFYIVEDYGEGSALICRLHHSLADGMALMQVLLSMGSTNPLKSGRGDHVISQAVCTPDLKDQNLRRWECVSEPTRRLLGEVVRNGIEILVEPGRALEYLRSAASYTRTVGRLVVRLPDSKTLLKGTIGGEKCATWSDPISLEEIKGISQVLGGTINDVLLSLVSGAIRRYIETNGESVDSTHITGFIPVNLRPTEFDGELGNKIGLVLLDLPVGTSDPLSRQYELKRNMDVLKSTNEPIITYGLLNVVGASPRKIQEVIVRVFDRKGSMVITNVPGPKERLYLAGAPVETIMAWVPQPGRLGVGVSIISYFGKVYLGIASDKSLIPDPERIIVNFGDELREMRSLVDDLLEKRYKPIAEMHSELDKALSMIDELIESAKVQ